MIRLQYLSNGNWIDCGEFNNERIAWMTLGGDNLNYRTIDENGVVLTDNSKKDFKS